MRAIGKGGLLALVSAALESGPSPQPVPRRCLFAHPPPTSCPRAGVRTPSSATCPRTCPGTQQGHVRNSPAFPMCRARPVLLFPGLSSRAGDAQRTLAPLCRAQGSFLDITPMDGMRCRHQGLLGSSKAGTLMTDAPAGAVPVCPADTCFWGHRKVSADLRVP